MDQGKESSQDIPQPINPQSAPAPIIMADNAKPVEARSDGTVAATHKRGNLEKAQLDGASRGTQDASKATAGQILKTVSEEAVSPTRTPKSLPHLDLEIPSDPNRNPPSPPRRKFKSPFSWLSRNPSIPEKRVASPPPPLPSRRGTQSSVTTLGCEAGGADSNKESLKDRFRLLRMREDAGLQTADESEGFRPGRGMMRAKSTDAAMTLPGLEGDGLAVPKQRAASTAGLAFNNPTLNQSLPQGTAAGTSTGPSADQNNSVDWDLWQAVVYEGPAAVARTSADELSQSIARGIPSAIRGVVWQVLAQSKNEQLEAVYHDLASRGAMDTARRPSEVKRRPSEVKKHESTANVPPPSVLSKEAEMSSASSTRSQESSLASPPSEFVDSVTSQEDTASEPHSRRPSVAGVEPQRKSVDPAALQKLEKVIKRDLGTRTSFSKFLMSSGLQNGLFGICKAYALFDEEVGYAQGMNFIAMPLLFNMPEDEAFCLFVRLMNHYGLRDMFVQDMHGLHLHLYQFERLLEDFEPAVYCHLHRRGVNPQLYATQWFLTLFAYRFPLQLVLRIYDLILSEGLESAILKFGIVLMQKNATQLLQMTDMTVLTTFLKERLFDVYIDKAPSTSSVLESGFFGSAGGIDKEVYRADALVQDACAVKITPAMLKTYAAEWEEKVRDEKEKLAAEDSLRSGNASLSLRVRTLEEKAERNDLDHVAVASELVRTKVENQQLADANEALKMRVGELQAIVSAQPGEVEARLKQEMERIMQRNIEVQNENRHLEEATAEMEAELVKTKVLHAEMHEELESMRQKWHSISAMMNGKA